MKIIVKVSCLVLIYSFSLYSYADNLEMRWSSAGKKSGEFRHCIAINEPAESKESTWDDNYLCFNKSDHGFKYSYGGKSKTCAVHH